MRVVRVLAAWTHPDGFEPISNVLAGSNLVNAYRGQHGRDAAVTPGLLFVGDVVCTTNPAAGRGVALGFRQARTLLALLDADDDLRSVAPGFDEWCLDNLRPWYDDHVYWDATELHRFAGADLDLDARIPSDVVCACGQVDPSIMAAAGPYLAMRATPKILDSVQEKARAVLRNKMAPRRTRTARPGTSWFNWRCHRCRRPPYICPRTRANAAC